jgi:hypothetical protein
MPALTSVLELSTASATNIQLGLDDLELCIAGGVELGLVVVVLHGYINVLGVAATVDSF